ncbi:hypothetical protein [Nonomuraea angiospora]
MDEQHEAIQLAQTASRRLAQARADWLIAISRYLEALGSIRVEPVDVRPGNVHWIFVQMISPNVRPGEVWYRVTRRGAAVGRLPGYYQLHELTELLETLELGLADLREVGGNADAGTA